MRKEKAGRIRGFEVVLSQSLVASRPDPPVSPSVGSGGSTLVFCFSRKNKKPRLTPWKVDPLDYLSFGPLSPQPRQPERSTSSDRLRHSRDFALTGIDVETGRRLLGPW
jgi:hypothetical protein